MLHKKEERKNSYLHYLRKTHTKSNNSYLHYLGITHTGIKQKRKYIDSFLCLIMF